MTERCLAGCAEPAVAHHPTGRVGRGYADPAFTVPLCAPCHRQAHAQLRALGLDTPVPPGDEALATEVRLRRLAVLARQLLAILDALRARLFALAVMAEQAADAVARRRRATAESGS